MHIDSLRDHVGRYLNRTLSRSQPEFSEATAFLSGHPTWSQRLGEVVAMRVRRSRLNKSLQLQLKTNRKWFTVSWTACASRRRPQRADARPPELRRLHAAMRASVRPQILRWRRVQFGPRRCAECGADGKMQVDHVDPPFCQIRDAFLRDTAAAPTEFVLRSAASAIPAFRPEDGDFARSWNAHHAAHAEYQFLCPPCNRKKSQN